MLPPCASAACFAIGALRLFGQGSTQAAASFAAGCSIVLLGVAGIYPVAAAAQVPNRPGLRVDRADMPMIPEPHSLPAVPH